MKNLVIVGEFDSDNVGDQMIGEGQAMLFAREGWHVTITSLEPIGRVTASDPGTIGSSGLRAFHRRIYRRSVWYRHLVETALFAKYRSNFERRAGEIVSGADVIIIGGGQLLSDGTLRMMRRIQSLAREANRQRTPILAFGTGISKPRTPISNGLLTEILGRLTSESRFRDSASIEIARRSMSMELLAEEAVPDCAIIRVACDAKWLANSAEIGLVGLAPMSEASLGHSSSESDRSDAWWVDVIDLLTQQGYRPLLFCSGVASDYHRCLTVQRECKARGLHVEVAPRPENSEDFLALLACMDKMLSQRLHASISFYSLGKTPTSASWDRKVDQFYRRIGLDGRVVDPGLAGPEATVFVLLREESPSIAPEELVSISKAMARECLDLATPTGLPLEF